MWSLLLNIEQVHLNNPPKVPGLNAPNPKRASFWIPAKSTSWCPFEEGQYPPEDDDGDNTNEDGDSVHDHDGGSGRADSDRGGDDNKDDEHDNDDTIFIHFRPRYV